MADARPRFYTLRKHRKKSIVFAAFGLWLVRYGVNRFREYLTRRQFCEEARVYAEEITPALQKPRRFMLFFNSTAGKGDAEKLFRRNAEPLFHLAGLDVTIVKTDYEGQIKTLMQYLDPSIDGVIVAGGGGTLLEAVTGLLRRPDQEKLSKIPFGVIPIGTRNSFYQKMFGKSQLTQAREIGEAAMAIVKGDTCPVDVMEIKGDTGRPTFAVNGIQWGAFRDAAESYDKYWWSGPLRKKVAYIMTTLLNWPPTHHALLSYLAPDASSKTSLSASAANSSGGFLSSRMTSQVMASAVNSNNSGSFSSSDLISSGWVHTSLETLGISVDLAKDIQGEGVLNVGAWSSLLPKMDFIKIGWKMEKNQQETNDTVNCRKYPDVQELKLEPKDVDGSWYSIDGEPFDARPIHVILQPNKLLFFSNKKI